VNETSISHGWDRAVSSNSRASAVHSHSRHPDNHADLVSDEAAATDSNRNADSGADDDTSTSTGNVHATKMKTAIAIVFLLFAARLMAQSPGPPSCTVSGVVVNPDGTPFVNGSINFNSKTVQVINGLPVYPTIVNTTTDATGSIGAVLLPQGLVMQITMCAKAGSCSAAFSALVPVSSTSDFGKMIMGTQMAQPIPNGATNQIFGVNNGNTPEWETVTGDGAFSWAAAHAYTLTVNKLNGIVPGGTCPGGFVNAISSSGVPSCGSGVVGPPGPTGPTGPQGPQGVAGPTGATGPQGTPGAAGTVGATGPQGPQGVAGPTGTAGVPGAAGTQGATGPTGATGSAGAQGPAGPAPNGSPPSVVGYSGTNTVESDLVGGDLTLARPSAGNYTATVGGLKGTSVPTLASGYLHYNGSVFVWDTPSGSGGGIPEAPTDSHNYARNNSAWNNVDAVYAPLAGPTFTGTLTAQVAVFTGPVASQNNILFSNGQFAYWTAGSPTTLQLISYGPSNADLLNNGFTNGAGTYTAQQTGATDIQLRGNHINFTANTGLTAGNTYTPTTVATVDGTGINLPTGLTYKVNGVPISGGGGVTSITAGTGLTGGAITTSGTIALGANPAGGQLNFAPIDSPVFTTIATAPTLVVSNTGSTSIFFGNTTTPGASLLSTGSDSFHFTAGAYYNGTSFIAAATAAQDVGMFNDGMYFSANLGLTTGNPFTFTNIATIKTPGGMNLLVGTYQVNGVNFGGTCTGGQFVSAISAGVVPTCSTPAGGGVPAGGPPQLVGYSATNTGEAETLSGDASLTRASAGSYTIAVTKTNGTAFGALATLGVGTGLTSTGGNLAVTAPVTVALGGTGRVNPAAHVIAQYEGTNPMNVTSLLAATAGNIVIDQGSGLDWLSKPVSGDATITSAGVVTVGGIKGVSVPTLAAGYLQYTGSAFAWTTPGGAASVTTWTPALQLGGGSVGMTYSHQTGYYTQNGKQITAYFDISLSAKGTSTGSAQICGLPVATYTSAGEQGPWLVNNQLGMTGLSGILVTIITGNTTCLYIYQQASTGTALGTQAFDTNFTNTSYLIGNVTYLTN
jgi:hypothetical protein